MKLINLKKNGLFIRVTRDEAISLIISLSQQLEDKNPNEGRREYYPEGASYFTIAVHDDKEMSWLNRQTIQKAKKKKGKK